jgi:hypothetical protein
MTALTRRRDPDSREEIWLIFLWRCTSRDIRRSRMLRGYVKGWLGAVYA